MKKFLILATVLCVALTAGAKKLTVLNVDKGQVPNDVFGCEVSLTEENAAKKGSMMLKISIGKEMKDGAWAETSSGGKVWDGFDLFKCNIFNSSKKPVKLQFDYQPGSYCAYDKRFIVQFQLKPGMNEIEVELAGAVANNGSAIDFKQKAGCWGFAFDATCAGVDLYMGNQTVETSEPDKK